MSEIPDDLTRIAADIVLGFAKDLTKSDAMIDCVARALLAERERCAKIADDTTREIGRGDFGLIGPVGVGRAISAAIRQ